MQHFEQLIATYRAAPSLIFSKLILTIVPKHDVSIKYRHAFYRLGTFVKIMKHKRIKLLYVFAPQKGACMHENGLPIGLIKSMHKRGSLVSLTKLFHSCSKNGISFLCMGGNLNFHWLKYLLTMHLHILWTLTFTFTHVSHNVSKNNACSFFCFLIF